MAVHATALMWHVLAVHAATRTSVTAARGALAAPHSAAFGARAHARAPTCTMLELARLPLHLSAFAASSPLTHLGAAFSTVSKASATRDRPEQRKPRYLAGGGERLGLTARERELFDFLRDVVSASECGTVMRVAGGWVRDKLLGRDTDDIDLALDNMTGLGFAELVKARLEELGEPLHIGVIQANPEQSKHLETVAISIKGFAVDLVNLRSEEYSSGSRIPSDVHFGSPTSDALRRDLTINSLFYNLETDCIEDMTGRALADLEAGVITTPLAPLETLLDDPLRVLRAIRFAARFDYTIDPQLRAAMDDPGVQAQLGAKISRERVLRELYSMLGAAGAAPVRAMRLIHKLRLHEAILLPGVVSSADGAPDGVGAAVAAAASGECGGAAERAARAHELSRTLRASTGAIEALHAVLCEANALCSDWHDATAEAMRQLRADGRAGAEALASSGAPSTAALEQMLTEMHVDTKARRRLWVAVVLAPLHSPALSTAGAADAAVERLRPDRALPAAGTARKGKRAVPALPVRRASGLAERVMRAGLRGMTSQDISAVLKMHAHAHEFAELADSFVREDERTSDEHDHAQRSPPAGRRQVGLIIRSAGSHWQECLQLALVRALPPLPVRPSAGQVREWRADPTTQRTLAGFGRLCALIEAEQLQDAWQLAPLINGNELLELGIPKGPAVGKATNALLAWQLDHPEATVDEARAFVQDSVIDEVAG